MAVNNFFRKKNLKLTYAQQHIRMQMLHPQFRCKELTHLKAIWIGTIRPTELSDSYFVRVIYKSFKRPKIQILSPKLNLPEGKTKLPHVFEKDELCLYYQSNEWNSGKYIAETTIPWISLWLFYYEGWLITGKWFGGGVEPQQITKN